MNIAFICNEYPPAQGGGIGPAVRALARGLVAAGHVAIVVGLYEHEAVEEDEGVIVYRLAFPMGAAIRRVLLARRFLHARLAALCRRHAIDAVEWPDFQGLFHVPTPGATDIVKLHGTTLSHRVHGLIKTHWIAQPSWEHFERRTLHRIPFWVGVSRTFLEEWKAYFPWVPQVEGVVHNPVDSRLFAPPPASEARQRQVFFSGAFRERKGIRTLVQGAHLAMQRGVDFRLVLMGYEAEYTQAQLRALAPGAGHRLAFVPFGSQREVARYMRASAVFAMPSHYESCGNGWLEAAMCGTPAIGSTAACGPEIVRHGVDGLNVAPGDARATSDAIETLLCDAGRWHGMSQAAQTDAPHRFGVAACVQASLNFYARCRDADRQRA
ncbi:glycosyltransferase family 4 protein [Pseudorhodoferax sp. Leaf267]|uniref:glycosyltransferase family 4 protein n=1 Tax=Pseudorhodoferax sp. Leaf267 TaxID=1736316 RepID=UPI000701B126|nr:glycosyltransferase family 4 protein [Pseudorhodoferax sp. Leaf267]KQP14324.1 hypothetical protein ASF43_16050 [Pseudorhodoferax sp. Leaf267]